MAAVAVALLAVGIVGLLSLDEPASAVSANDFAAWEESETPPEPSPGDPKKREPEKEEVEKKEAKKKKPKKEDARKEETKSEDAERPAEKADREKAESKPKADETSESKPKPRPKPKVKKVDWDPAVLEVVTNFDKADVTVNGIAYPEYTKPGEPTGVVLPAGGPYWVEVEAEGNTKTFEVYLKPNETRLLLVDLTGFNGKPRRVNQPSVPEPKRAENKEEDDEKGPGKVTVYSKPPGTIMIDGKKSSDKTPGTLEVENGRHEIQVEYDGGGVSEKKIVRVREGSRIKLFFRKRD